MMNTTFTSTAKRVAAGKKVKYTIFADGVEIGDRTTSKAGYRAVSVARHSYARACLQVKGSTAHNEQTLIQYQGYLANPEAALAAEKTAFHRENMAKWIQDGTVAKWVEDVKDQIVKGKARLDELATMTQDSPEFSKWYIVAFTNTGKLNGGEWLFAEQLVTLNQPE
ncbi:MAG: hypothetical protein ACOYB3_01505 [Azonexus sp.]